MTTTLIRSNVATAGDVYHIPDDAFDEETKLAWEIQEIVNRYALLGKEADPSMLETLRAQRAIQPLSWFRTALAQAVTSLLWESGMTAQEVLAKLDGQLAPGGDRDEFSRQVSRALEKPGPDGRGPARLYVGLGKGDRALRGEPTPPEHVAMCLGYPQLTASVRTCVEALRRQEAQDATCKVPVMGNGHGRGDDPTVKVPVLPA